MIVLKDIQSSFAKNKFYAKKGDIVMLVANHGEVLVCENEFGERFPCKAADMMVTSGDVKKVTEQSKEPFIFAETPELSTPEKAMPKFVTFDKPIALKATEAVPQKKKGNINKSSQGSLF